MSNNSNSVMKTIVSGSAWSFIGVLLAAAFFYWQEYRNPFDFKMELVDEFNLVEVKEEISDLKIIYKKEDILENEKEIKVIRFRISNLGDTILQSYYDQLEEFGIDFGKAKVLNVEVLNSNSDDLRKKLISSKNNLEQETNKIIFSKVIFESGDVIVFKVTLLQLSNDKLSVNVLGNLANIDRLKIVAAETGETEEKDPIPTWAWVLIGYLTLIIGMVTLGMIVESLKKKEKRKKVKDFRVNHKNLGDPQEIIIGLYLSGDSKNYLIKPMLKNDYVLDLIEYVKEEVNNKPKLPFSILSSQALRPETLPKEIFKVDKADVVFNPENEQFIKDFFGAVL